MYTAAIQTDNRRCRSPSSYLAFMLTRPAVTGTSVADGDVTLTIAEARRDDPVRRIRRATRCPAHCFAGSPTPSPGWDATPWSDTCLAHSRNLHRSPQIGQSTLRDEPVYLASCLRGPRYRGRRLQAATSPSRLPRESARSASRIRRATRCRAHCSDVSRKRSHGCGTDPGCARHRAAK